MKVEDYPRFTIIMRGYTYEQAYSVLTAMSGLEKEFAVEITYQQVKQIIW
jgi:2-dehydro-3-deoxyphosphogluconate aldolase/(4S)-4-hydroxy-2-oxoglutarate aldolase